MGNHRVKRELNMRIAIVVAHSDDAEISMGGTISKYRDNEPIIIHTSDSVYTNFNGEVHRTKEEVEEEMYNGLKELGVLEGNVFNLGYVTKWVPSDSNIIEKIDEIFHQMSITHVFTHPLNDTHSDHANTAKAVFTAARRIPNLFTFEPIWPAATISLFQPQTFIDISDHYINKLNAMLMHKSQHEKYGQIWVDSIDALSRMRGIEIGVERAEAFTCIKQKMELL